MLILIVTDLFLSIFADLILETTQSSSHKKETWETPYFSS